ncbi:MULTISPECIES: hypothetical protein [Aquimarina]|uniref:Uncharacterized protein n=1 Tax=Aquimarina algiphila TaxID=2047982 RepID=A0A554VP77_9FLAO|nr:MULTISPECIES: hypothetical protein [Aquimarina]TSE10204.1 hypothetical protein FOF46_05535 [Aquimarina algiphila]
MKFYIIILCLLPFTIFTNCKSDKQNSDKINVNSTEKEQKDISELSYLEIYHQLFSNKSGGFDAHGDLYGQEAISNLSISEHPSDCGNVLFLSNTADKIITLAIEASFNFPGNPNATMVRAYTINPNEKISIGNSILCYDNKEYDIKREIISAGFTTN